VPKLKKSLKTQQIGFLSAKKNLLSQFRTAIFPKWNKKIPNGLLGILENQLSTSLLRSSVSLAYFLPVDQVPEGRDIVWASVLVMQVVGMLPYI
jgi:hypothetical protein